MRTRRGYTRPMRTTLVVVALGLLLAAACGTEKSRVKEPDDGFTAARLDGRYDDDDRIVKMLSPEQRDALDRAGMMRHSAVDDAAGDGELAEGDEVAADEEGEDAEHTTGEKVTGTMMSLLAVGVTLGMMVAPYLLF